MQPEAGQAHQSDGPQLRRHRIRHRPDRHRPVGLFSVSAVCILPASVSRRYHRYIGSCHSLLSFLISRGRVSLPNSLCFVGSNISSSTTSNPIRRSLNPHGIPQFLAFHQKPLLAVHTGFLAISVPDYRNFSTAMRAYLIPNHWLICHRPLPPAGGGQAVPGLVANG